MKTLVPAIALLVSGAAALTTGAASRPGTELRRQSPVVLADEGSGRDVPLDGTLGVVTLDKTYGVAPAGRDGNDLIGFYNEDGTLWHRFTFYYDDSDGVFEYYREDFRPFAFHPDYFLLALRCVAEDEDRYRVVVDEGSGLEKYVRKRDGHLKLESWQEHILKAFSIDIGKEGKTPVRRSPGGERLEPDAGKIERFEPVGFSGDWLRIRWQDPADGQQTVAGWVRWRKDGRLLIDWFYFA